MSKKNYTTHWRKGAQLPTGIVGKSRSLLRNIALSVASNINKKSEENYLRCLYSHYVFDDQRNDFVSLITELKKIGEFIDTDTCTAMLLGEQKIDKKYFHLSFDDGFRNNFTNILPILIEHEIPAIFFLPSSFIDANWGNTKYYCLKIAQYPTVIEMLSWSEAREIISLGYEIGSHTKTHARFSTISNDKLMMEDEIFGSKKELETKLDCECKYISWPYGRLTDADDESLKMAREAGYTACFGAYRGSVRPKMTDIFRIPRHNFAVEWPISHIKYFARGNMEVKA